MVNNSRLATDNRVATGKLGPAQAGLDMHTLQVTGVTRNATGALNLFHPEIPSGSYKMVS
jgi:hypothetical protein